jgi:transcriptional regulator with XRE-family HTH domain
MEAKRLEICKKIVHKRIVMGLSQADLAKATGLGIATIKRMESENFWPGLRQLLIVCKALDLTFTIHDN